MIFLVLTVDGTFRNLYLFRISLLFFFFCYRDNKYLEKSSASRTCAVGGFFISIPIFLTGKLAHS